jgi:hypothetical protein
VVEGAHDPGRLARASPETTEVPVPRVHPYTSRALLGVVDRPTDLARVAPETDATRDKPLALHEGAPALTAKELR